MKYINLTKGKRAIVDDADFETVSGCKWHYVSYAMRNIRENGKQTKWYMHWSIIGKPKNGLQVDHINENKLDNRRLNLRICNRSENMINRKLFKNKTDAKYFGVFPCGRKYVGKLQRNYILYATKSYITQKEAKIAREILSKDLSVAYRIYRHLNKQITNPI
mgnify:CR=1 FL=1